MKYYYTENNQRKGPFSIDELKNRNLNENTLVWYNGLEKWTMLKNVPELQNALKQEIRTKYYLLVNNNKTGPFYLVDLEEKNITPTTMVWFKSLAQWTQAKEIDELEQFIMPELPSELQEEEHTTNSFSSVPDLPTPTNDGVKLPDDISLIYMPRLSDTMEEAVVAKWLKEEGDKVSEGDILAEIETDKATMEFESSYDGIILYIALEKGESAVVGALICILSKHKYDKNEILQILERENLLQNPEESSIKEDDVFNLFSNDEQHINEDDEEEIDEYDDYDEDEPDDYFTDEKECIFCKETIKANAEICKHCNSEQISEEKLQDVIDEMKPSNRYSALILSIAGIISLIIAIILANVFNLDKEENETVFVIIVFILFFILSGFIYYFVDKYLDDNHNDEMGKLTAYQLLKKHKEFKTKQEQKRKRNKIISRVGDIIIIIIVLFVLYVFISNS